MVEELRRVGAGVHLAEPTETAGLRGPKKRAKGDRADARHLRELLMVGRLPESWIAPDHMRAGRRGKALMAHYGIGPLVAVTVLSELGDCTRFSSSRHAVRYAGMDITVYQSDRHRGETTRRRCLGPLSGGPVSQAGREDRRNGDTCRPSPPRPSAAMPATAPANAATHAAIIRSRRWRRRASSITPASSTDDVHAEQCGR